jgi:hypothetical protein
MESDTEDMLDLQIGQADIEGMELEEPPLASPPRVE